jgi:UDP-N-acetylmuramyl pentapeptide phosphotransferase/UDP-N-acetylglucosamine-1-phosphate transferase
MATIGFILIITALISWGMGYPFFLILSHFNVIDRPNSRSSHKKITVRGGGSGFIFVIVTATWIYLLSLHQVNHGFLVFTFCILFLAVISFVDDLRSISSKFRFGCHLLSTLIVVLIVLLGHSDLDTAQQSLNAQPGILNEADNIQFNTLALPIRIFLIGLATLWMVGYTNAFNFMDGINGLASWQAALTSFGMGVVGFLAWHSMHPGMELKSFLEVDTLQYLMPVVVCFIISGAMIGFLPHNFPKAKMFMGDVGSAPLGFMLSALVLWIARDFGWWLIIPLALLHFNFVMDTGLTLLRRMWRRDQWWKAHREHFYQLLIRSGKSHVFVSSLEFGLQLVVLALVVRYLFAGSIERIMLVAAIMGIWGCFFKYCHHNFKVFEEHCYE